jgi:hypothetical protein
MSTRFAQLLALSCAAFYLLGCSNAANASDKGTLKYTLTVQPQALKAKAGEKGAVKLLVKPDGSAHIDPRAPLLFEAKAGDKISVDKAELRHADGKETADKAVEFEVPFTAKAAGSDQIQVHADFFLCTAKLCERQVTDVKVPVTVQ